MSKFRKTQSREVPALNTASLPDLIFTLLFFFMIVTNMREIPMKMKVDIPEATELQKIRKDAPIIYIIVSKDSPKLQVNTDFVLLQDLPDYLLNEKNKLAPEKQNQITVSLRSDKEVKMGMINDIKLILQENGIQTVHYSANLKGKQGECT